MSKTVTIGTRNSLLARAQAVSVQQALDALRIPTQLKFISTPGDQSTEPINKIGVGVFTSTLRTALLDKEIDIAVHSYKDLPTAPLPGITIAAVPARIDPRDVLISRNGQVMAMLAPGSSIGTSAPRRTSQINIRGFGLEIRPLRGNLNTRLQKVRDGELDAIVVAYAGLLRLGQESLVTEIFDPLDMMPAPAQGALAVECRSEDHDVIAILRQLDHNASRLTVLAERSLLSRLEAGCSAPIGATAEIVESFDKDDKIIEELFLRAVVCSPDGSDILRGSITGNPQQAEQLGLQLAEELLERGANEVLFSIA